jgi:hypothetical protein
MSPKLFKNVGKSLPVYHFENGEKMRKLIWGGIWRNAKKMKNDKMKKMRWYMVSK